MLVVPFENVLYTVWEANKMRYEPFSCLVFWLVEFDGWDAAGQKGLGKAGPWKSAALQVPGVDKTNTLSFYNASWSTGQVNTGAVLFSVGFSVPLIVILVGLFP